ncbi:DUF3019 domain-containing protein [Colwellia sp. UCD-KL20]|uniref:DUF3019 domain-containing protein n=1 Tax=Colwellia sp. UCD-KL20 TaxID=1917165 RepID=UPI00097142D0|nr:DUF3019 domain-containing protein [Colwellia sp. UCD-KL20]
MNFKKMFLTLFMFYLTISKVVAQDELTSSVLQSSEASSVINMSISPSICVVKTRGDLCQMTTYVMWQAGLAIDACLYQNDDLITCWEKKRQIKKKLELSLIQDIIFTLKDQDKVLAKQHVKVNASHSPKYRRRLRSQWSLF